MIDKEICIIIILVVFVIVGYFVCNSTIFENFVSEEQEQEENHKDAGTWLTRPNRIIMIRHGEKDKIDKNYCHPDPDLNINGILRALCLTSYFGVDHGNTISPYDVSTKLFPPGILTKVDTSRQSSYGVQTQFDISQLSPNTLLPSNTMIYGQGVKKCCSSTRPIYTTAIVAKAFNFEHPTAISRRGNEIPINLMINRTNPAVCSVTTKDNRYNASFDNNSKGIKDLAKHIKTDPIHNGKNIIICWEHKALTDVIKELFPNAPTIYYNDNEDPTTGKAENVFDRTWLFTFMENNKVKFDAHYNFIVSNAVCIPDKKINESSYTKVFDL